MDEDEARATAPAKPRARKGPAKRAPKRKRAVPWSAKRAKLFLESLAETANIAASARASGLSESTIRRHRASDEAFAAAWTAALGEGFEKLQTMLLGRALAGVEKPVWHGGKQVGTIVEYSDRLALALLTAHRGTVTGAAAPAPGLTDREMRDELARRLSEMNLRMGGEG